MIAWFPHSMFNLSLLICRISLQRLSMIILISKTVRNNDYGDSRDLTVAWRRAMPHQRPDVKIVDANRRLLPNDYLQLLSGAQVRMNGQCNFSAGSTDEITGNLLTAASALLLNRRSLLSRGHLLVDLLARGFWVLISPSRRWNRSVSFPRHESQADSAGFHARYQSPFALDV